MLAPRVVGVPKETSAGAGFDAVAVADRYDADERDNPILTHMRARLCRELFNAFPVGGRLLELGSGTGTDAARLVAERACSVALVDVSARLLARAAAKIRAARADGGLLGHHLMPARAIGELLPTYGLASFDGAYSSLGPLNCEPALAPVAQGLAALVRPGGAVVLSVMNRWCATETAWFLLRGRPRAAARRWGGPILAAAYPGGPKDVRTTYYSHREIARAFEGSFRVEHVEALPLLWPPPYLASVVAPLESLLRRLERVEQAAARLPVLRQLGDHVLVRLRRT
jgi:SAM-dependent methyltransferase